MEGKNATDEAVGKQRIEDTVQYNSLQLSLTICLWMVGGTHLQLCARHFEELS